MKVRVAQSCPTLCDPLDYTLHGLLQARILDWVAFFFSRESSQPRDWTQVSLITGRFFTSWATREAPQKNKSDSTEDLLLYFKLCILLLLLQVRNVPQVASLVAQMVKNPLAMQETWIRSLGWEDPLEKGMTTHSSILAWRIPWMEEPGRL